MQLKRLHSSFLNFPRAHLHPQVLCKGIISCAPTCRAKLLYALFTKKTHKDIKKKNHTTKMHCNWTPHCCNVSNNISAYIQRWYLKVSFQSFHKKASCCISIAVFIFAYFYSSKILSSEFHYCYLQ